MARTNTLTNFLTDVADAIRTKTGGSAQIPAANFDTEILGITTGGVMTQEEYDNAEDLSELILGTSYSCTISFIDAEETVVPINNLTITKNTISYNYTTNNDDTITAILPVGTYTLAYEYDGNTIHKEITVSATSTEFELFAAKHVELNYIQGTGTQYINTLYRPTENTKTEISVETINLTDTFVPFGTRENARLDYIVGINFQNKSYIQYNDNGAIYSEESSADLLNTKMLITLDNTLCRISYGENNNIDIVPVDTTAFTCITDLYIGGNNNNGTVQYVQPYKLYYCKIYENNVLVKDLIPVKIDGNIACLYDRVSDTYFYNAGTGDYIAG